MKAENRTTIDDEQKQEVFAFLDELRESGATNMFGAAPYIVEFDSDITLPQARILLVEWMNGFERLP